MRNGPEHDDILDSVAASISEGSAIEWQQVAGRVTDEDSAVLEQLRLLEQIARFHQDAQSNGAAPAPAGDDSDDPRTWARFLILGRIGSGTVADVYRAHDTKLQGDVALKLIRQDRLGRANALRLLEQAQRLARLRHANVVTVYGADQADGRAGVWMELLRGATLEELLQQRGMFDARDAAQVGLDVCRAVAALHRAGIVVGDIDAHNILREEDGRNVLIDVGVAQALDAGAPPSQATDVYSIGVLLFYLVTNTHPGRGGSSSGASHEASPRNLRPDLPEELIAILERALATDPRQRFQRAGELEIALAGFLRTPAAG